MSPKRVRHDPNRAAHRAPSTLPDLTQRPAAGGLFSDFGLCLVRPVEKFDMLRALACLAGCPAPPSGTMSRRMHQTLAYLLTGRSEKEIGKALHVRTGTVHVYVKALYKQLNVNSRAELMALFVHPSPAAVLSRELNRGGGQHG